MEANEIQIGGEHYRTSLQHWDIVARYGIRYLEGNATKYVTRWRSKDGIKDLQKACHYVTKIIELNNEGNYPGSGVKIHSIQIKEYVKENNLTEVEGDICQLLFNWKHPVDLQEARKSIALLAMTAEL